MLDVIEARSEFKERPLSFTNVEAHFLYVFLGEFHTKEEVVQNGPKFSYQRHSIDDLGWPAL